MKKSTMRDLTIEELRKIEGGGPIGKIIGWLAGCFVVSARNEIEVTGKIDPTWR